MSQVLPSGLALLQAPSVQIDYLAGAKAGSRKFSYLCASVVTTVTTWEKRSGILLEGQNASLHPHVLAPV